MNVDTIKIVAGVIGFIISVPLFVALIRAGMFFGSMEQTVRQVRTDFDVHMKTIESYIDRTEKRIGDQGDTLSDHSGKIAILWDGWERRKP